MSINWERIGNIVGLGLQGYGAYEDIQNQLSAEDQLWLAQRTMPDVNNPFRNVQVEFDETGRPIINESFSDAIQPIFDSLVAEALGPVDRYEIGEGLQRMDRAQQDYQLSRYGQDPTNGVPSGVSPGAMQDLGGDLAEEPNYGPGGDPGTPNAGNVGETGNQGGNSSFNPVQGDRPGGVTGTFPGHPGANGPGTWSGIYDFMDFAQQNPTVFNLLGQLSGVPGLGFLDNLSEFYFNNFGEPAPGNPAYGGEGYGPNDPFTPYLDPDSEGVYGPPGGNPNQPHISPTSGKDYAGRNPGDMGFYNTTIYDRQNPQNGGNLPFERTEPGYRQEFPEHLLPPWMRTR